MWSFDSVIDLYRDISGRVRARIQLRDDVNGAVETHELKFQDTPTVQERTAAVVKLVNTINEMRYPPPDPSQYDGQLPAALRTALLNRGVWRVKFNRMDDWIYLV